MRHTERLVDTCILGQVGLFDHYIVQFDPGGAESRDFTIVTKQDINSVVSALVPYLTESIHASFQQQIRPSETLTPNQCSQKISANHNAGDEDTTVTVMVSESCLAGAYNTGDLQAKVQQVLLQQAEHTIGKGYVLSSYVQTSPMQTDIQHGTLLIAASYQGRMIYQFSQQDLQNLRHQLAGKTKQQARVILIHLNGVKQISLQVKGTNGKLPINTANINILFVVDNQ